MMLGRATLIVVRVGAILIVTQNRMCIMSKQVTRRAFEHTAPTFLNRTRFQVIGNRARSVAALEHLRIGPQDVSCGWLKRVALRYRVATRISVNVCARPRLASKTITVPFFDESRGARKTTALAIFSTTFVKVSLSAILVIAIYLGSILSQKELRRACKHAAFAFNHSARFQVIYRTRAILAANRFCIRPVDPPDRWNQGVAPTSWQATGISVRIV
jgi:hypothetical protein